MKAQIVKTKENRKEGGKVGGFRVDIPAVRIRVVEYLLETGLLLSNISASARISRMTLWRFLHGQAVAPQTVHRILAVIGVSVAEVAAAAVSATPGAVSA